MNCRNKYEKQAFIWLARVFYEICDKITGGGFDPIIKVVI